MDSLRQRENMEILDVFKNLHSQVNALTNRQVQTFPDTLKPKTQRDLVSEVSVDKAIESLNKTLEQKLGALEFVVQNLDQGQVNVASSDKQSLTQSFQSTINTGDFIPLWNSIVRSYKEIGLSRESQNIIKVKIQDLLPNLDAMCYGLKEAIEYIFQQPFITDQPRKGNKSNREREAEAKGQPLNPRLLTENLLVILDYLRTLSVYQLVKQQVDSGNLELLSVDLMNSAYENIFNTLSSDRVKLLKEVAPRGIFGKSSIRNIPLNVVDYKERLDALGDELGVNFDREYYDRLRDLPQNEVDRIMNQIRDEYLPNNSKNIKGIDTEIIKNVLNAVERVRLDEFRYLQALVAKEEIERETDVLSRPLEEEKGGERFLDEIEEPIEPIPPRAEDLPGFKFLNGEFIDAFREAQQEYDRLYPIWVETYEEYNRINQRNAFIQEMRDLKAMNDEAQREEAYNAKLKDLTEINEKLEELETVLEQGKRLLERAEEAYNRLVTRAKEKDLREMTKLVNEMVASTKKQPISLRPEEVPRPAGRGKPQKGKAIDTRGMATLRANYGYSDNESSSSSGSDSGSDSDSDCDPLYYDDRRNDNYSMKPMR